MATFGVLIDAEKVPAAVVGAALTELRRFGEPIIKRAYADWSQPGSGEWPRELDRHGITPMSGVEQSAGRHAVDSALAVDAVDMRFHGVLDGYAILCGDDSFADLAGRLRASGATVIGGGLSAVSNAFAEQCDSYLDLDTVVNSVNASRAALAREGMARTA